MGQVAVIGSGSWGTTLSIIVAQAQGTCSLWMHNYDEAREIAARRENVRFLPGVTLPVTEEATAAPAALSVFVISPLETESEPLMQKVAPLRQSALVMALGLRAREAWSARLGCR